MAIPVALITAAIGAGVKIWSGAQQRKQAKELAKLNQRPQYEGTETFEDLMQIFTEQAQYGIDPRARGAAMNDSNNVLTASLQAMLQGGGDPNSVANVYAQYGDQVNRLAVQDSQLRYQKVNALANTIQQMNGEQRDEFLYNQDAPFKDAAQLAAAKQSAGYSELMSGINQLLAGTLAHFSGQGYDDKGAKPDDKPYVPNQADWEGSAVG